MSIASRITAMTEHIDDIYDTVELTGVDTTGLNKNLVNVPNTLKDGFVDIINNGTDTLYENFPKVSQTGEEPTLNGIYEAPMRVDLNGNTEQTTYTGKNYAIITPRDISNYGLTITYDSNTGKISIKGKANTTVGVGVSNFSDLNIPSGEYTLSINKALPCLINYVVTDTQNTNRAFRIPAGSTNVTVNIPYDGISSGLFVAIENNVDYDLEFYLQLESGSTVTDYEPYVGGSPSPSPDFPQDIRVVKGDNTIKVTGKNLFDEETFITKNNVSCSETGIISSTGISSNIWDYENGNFYVTLPTGNWNFTLFFDIKESNINSGIRGFDENGNRIVNKMDLSNQDSISIPITLNQTTTLGIMFKLDSGKLKLQIEKGSTNTSYQPYQETTYPLNLGTTELCKIGDYKDVIFKNNQLSEYYDSTLDEDSWYLKKNIGKIDLSTLTWSSAGSDTSDYRRYYTNTIPNIKYVSSNTQVGNGIAEKYKIVKGQGISNLINVLAIDVSIVSVIDLESNNNPTGLFYYALATPTYTEITDTDLINQLEDLKTAKSVEGQTNITQTNEELPFILDVSGLKKD